MANLDPNRLDIRRNDRVTAVGATGSGKTTLIKALLWGLGHVVVLDSKRTFQLPKAWPVGFEVVDGDRKKVEKFSGPHTLIYRPALNEFGPENYQHIQWLFWWVYHRRNTVVYSDELAMHATPHNEGDGLKACIQLGRELGIGTWLSTQRPMKVPIIAFSEAEHLFAFRLKAEGDRHRVAEYTTPEIEDKPATGNGFYYWNDRRQDLRYYARANVGKVLVK